MTESLLTLREVAQLLRISKSKLYHERKAGRLRVVRFGGAVRVRERDVQSFIKAAAETQEQKKLLPAPTRPGLTSKADPALGRA